ncbi:putative AC transposase [Colletotrichum fructicola]|nr:putative AC transposase [Colletotrichum fructicola]
MSTAATAASASHANAYEMLGTPRLRISTQIAQALLVTPPLNSTIDDLPHIVVGSREFVLETQLSRRRGRGRSSWIRDHGEFLVEVIQSRAGASFWSCRRCDAKGSPRLFGAAATSAPQEHLLRHKVCRISAVSDEDSDSSTLPSSADTSGPPSYKRLRPNSNVPRAKITTLRDLSVASIVSADLPFVHFENAYVQQMFRYHNPEVAGEIPWGRTAIRDRLDDFCRRGEALVKSELHSALSKIHLSFDLWSSPNIYAFMAVTGHFIHADGTIQSRLLAFPQHHGNHSGLSLSETLIDAVDRYELRPRIGVTISDNATNNDTCLRAFYRSISPEMTDADVKARRMRCYGHILNLAARAFLFGADKEVLEAESDFFRLCERYEDDLELWRKLGPVGRLRNIVKFVRASPQRTERYRKAAAEVDGDSDFRIFSESRREAQLILNNDTRWNSTYLMIERAVKKKTEIQAFLLANNDDDDARQHISEKDLLSSEDWKVLAEIGMILEPFYLQTKRCEGWGINDGHGRLWEVTLGIEYLLSHLINWKIYYNASLSPSIDHGDEGDSQQSQQSQKRARRARRRHHNLQALPDHVHQDWASPASQSASRFESLNEEWQTFLRSSVEQAWQKLFDYYDLLGDSPLFSGAIILHPSYGISYLRDIWGQEHQEGWVEKALKTLTEYFDQWYRQPGEIYPSSWQAGMLPVDPGAGDGEDVHYRQWVNSWRRKTPPRTDELDLYLRQPPETTSDPVRWWRDHSETFPALSRLALDVFAVPAMAADCERAFSTAKLTLTSQRLSMVPGTIETLQLKFDKQRLKRHFRLTVIEDLTLDNAPVELVRQRFWTWVSDLPPEGDQQQDVPPIEHRDPVLFSNPLYVDTECLESLLAYEKAVEDGQHEDDASDLVFVKAINAEQPWARNDSEDEEEDMDEEENNDQHGGNNDVQKDNQHDPEYYWMLVTCTYLGGYWEQMGLGCQWHRQFSSCRYPQKQRWEPS